MYIWIFLFFDFVCLWHQKRPLSWLAQRTGHSMRKIWMSGITHFFYRRPSETDQTLPFKWLLPSPRLPVNHYQVRMSRCSHCGVSRNGLFLFSGRLSLKAKVEQVTRTKWTRHRICPEKKSTSQSTGQNVPRSESSPRADGIGCSRDNANLTI